MIDLATFLPGFARRPLSAGEWDALAKTIPGFIEWAAEPFEVVRRYAVRIEPHFAGVRWVLIAAKIGGGREIVYESGGAFYADDSTPPDHALDLAVQRAADGARLHYRKGLEIPRDVVAL